MFSTIYFHLEELVLSFLIRQISWWTPSAFVSPEESLIFQGEFSRHSLCRQVVLSFSCLNVPSLFLWHANFLLENLVIMLWGLHYILWVFVPFKILLVSQAWKSDYVSQCGFTWFPIIWDILGFLDSFPEIWWTFQPLFIWISFLVLSLSFVL